MRVPAGGEGLFFNKTFGKGDGVLLAPRAAIFFV